MLMALVVVESMANKRYYWLKLKENFFDDETIRYIEEQENGIKYSNFYLKLCLKSLRNEGTLIRMVGETLIPYNFKSLAVLTGVDIETVKESMELFQKIGIVKILESGEIYIPQIEKMTGCETDKAEMMRAKREKEKNSSNNVTGMLPDSSNNVTGMLPDSSNNVTDASSKCYTEYRDKSIEYRDREEDCKKEQAKPARTRFVKPSLDELKAYNEEKQLNVDCERFMDYYEANGWKAGRNPMKDWKAAMRNWARNDQSRKKEEPYYDLPEF